MTDATPSSVETSEPLPRIADEHATRRIGRRATEKYCRYAAIHVLIAAFSPLLTLAALRTSQAVFGMSMTFGEVTSDVTLYYTYAE